jgi:hypothetical protein
MRVWKNRLAAAIIKTPFRSAKIRVLFYKNKNNKIIPVSTALVQIIMAMEKI